MIACDLIATRRLFVFPPWSADGLLMFYPDPHKRSTVHGISKCCLASVKVLEWTVGMGIPAIPSNLSRKDTTIKWLL